MHRMSFPLPRRSHLTKLNWVKTVNREARKQMMVIVKFSRSQAP
jgi:hypothetical protein